MQKKSEIVFVTELDELKRECTSCKKEYITSVSKEEMSIKECDWCMRNSGFLSCIYCSKIFKMDTIKYKSCLNCRGKHTSTYWYKIIQGLFSYKLNPKDVKEIENIFASKQKDLKELVRLEMDKKLEAFRAKLDEEKYEKMQQAKRDLIVKLIKEIKKK